MSRIAGSSAGHFSLSKEQGAASKLARGPRSRGAVPGQELEPAAPPKKAHKRSKGGKKTAEDDGAADLAGAAGLRSSDAKGTAEGLLSLRHNTDFLLTILAHLMSRQQHTLVQA